MRAKKSLGQHFLKSEKAIREIVLAGAVSNGETVLEIGPGRGVLTRALLDAGARVIAIEKDRELIPVLNETFADEIASGRLEIIEADVLAFNSDTITEPYKLVANIPYYITGAIIERFLSTRNQPSSMTLLVQKEVAERVVARDGKESVLSIAVGAYGKPKLVATVPAGAFAPAPKVDSAILHIGDISRSYFDGFDETEFFSLVKFVFGRKRKQIGGSLAEYEGSKDVARSMLEAARIDPKTRPEELGLPAWKTLIGARVLEADKPAVYT